MKEDILREMYRAVLEGNIDLSRELAGKCVEEHLDPLRCIEEGPVRGLREIGKRFGAGECFLTDLMIAAQAMKVAMDVIMPEISKQKKRLEIGPRVLIGTVAGDIHSVGKDIVGCLLTTEGFEVIDLGVDVPDELFLKKVGELQPDILGLSALLSTTLIKQRDITLALQRANLRDKVKVMIGGAPVTERWADEIGADGYAEDALGAVKKAKDILAR